MVYLALISFAFAPQMVKAVDLGTRLSGRILLQVENHGEAWYINPANKKKYYMGRPENAFVLMHELGIGITNANLEKIEIAEANFGGIDSDGDGLADIFEDAIGTNPYNRDSDNDGYSDKGELFSGYKVKGTGLAVYDKNFTKKHLGQIFLQVENHGEAWYVNPVDNKRYFLGKPRDAFTVMRGLGLGIKNINLYPIPSDEEYIKKFNERLKGNYDDIYKQIISGENTAVQAKDDNGVLEVLTGKYSKDDKYVYYNSFIMPGADSATFKTIDDYYAKDKNKVYLEYRELVGADSASFQVLGFGYALDKNKVFYRLDAIVGADSTSFKYLGQGYAKDTNNVYYEGGIVNGKNPNTFSI